MSAPHLRAAVESVKHLLDTNPGPLSPQHKCAAVATLVHAGGWLELGWDAWNFGFHLTDQVCSMFSHANIGSDAGPPAGQQASLLQGAARRTCHCSSIRCML